LLELSDRGRRATDRVDELLRSQEGLGMLGELSGMSPPTPPGSHRHAQPATIVVCLAPYTLPGPFRDWATSHDGAATVLGITERLSGLKGLGNTWIQPTAGGAKVEIEM
jgi:hypothetical protein